MAVRPFFAFAWFGRCALIARIVTKVTGAPRGFTTNSKGVRQQLPFHEASQIRRVNGLPRRASTQRDRGTEFRSGSSSFLLTSHGP